MTDGTGFDPMPLSEFTPEEIQTVISSLTGDRSAWIKMIEQEKEDIKRLALKLSEANERLAHHEEMLAKSEAAQMRVYNFQMAQATKRDEERQKGETNDD